jgi:Fe-Mn family superoxide dismutase
METMAFTLPPLPYPQDALQPHISAETIAFHYGKHHQAYVNNLNTLTQGKPEANHSLEELIRTTDGGLFNNAAQVWNHTFYWHCLAPKGGGSPTGEVAAALNSACGSFDAFKDAFSKSALGLFGSGWTWLVQDSSGQIRIENMSNAGNPLREKMKPLLTLDVWEHAYYIDYRNARPEYVNVFWNLVNWDFVAQNLKA